MSADGRTTFALVYIPARGGVDQGQPEARVAQKALAGVTVAGASVKVTGLDALRGTGNDTQGAGTGVLLGTLLAALGALLVLAFVFRSFTAIIPLLMAVVAIPTTFLLIWPLTSITDVSVIVQFLVALIGLGIAIDYALLIVVHDQDAAAESRREHLRRRQDHPWPARTRVGRDSRPLELVAAAAARATPPRRRLTRPRRTVTSHGVGPNEDRQTCASPPVRARVAAHKSIKRSSRPDLSQEWELSPGRDTIRTADELITTTDSPSEGRGRPRERDRRCAAPEELVRGVRTVAAGEALLAPSITRRVIEDYAQRSPPVKHDGLEQLTARELEVLRLLATGKSNAELAQQLQAVVFAYEHGLVERA